MVTLHFFVGTFFCLVPNTIEQQSNSPISGSCNVDSPLVGRNDKVLLRFCTNLVPNVCCMTSVEGLDLNYHIFNVSWQTISRGSGDIRSTRHFGNVCTGCYLVFTTISISSRTYLALFADFLNIKSDSFFLFQRFFKKALFQGAKLVYSLSNSI